jgi:hypothetical protein
MVLIWYGFLLQGLMPTLLFAASHTVDSVAACTALVTQSSKLRNPGAMDFSVWQHVVQCGEPIVRVMRGTGNTFVLSSNPAHGTIICEPPLTGTYTFNQDIAISASPTFTNITATSVDSAASGTLTLGGTNASTVNIATSGAAAQTVNIGTGAGVTSINLAGATDALTIGGATNYYNLGVPSLGEHVVLVHTGAIQGPNEFNTIAAALTYIGTPSDPWTIEVAPGTYVENNPLTLQPNITIVSGGDAIVAAANSGSDLIVGAPDSTISGLTLTGATTTGSAAIRYSGGAAAGGVLFNVLNCTFGDNDILVALDDTVAPITACPVNGCLIISTAEFRIGFQAASTPANPIILSVSGLEWLTISNSIFSKLFEFSGLNASLLAENVSAGQATGTIPGVAVELSNAADGTIRNCSFYSFATFLSMPAGGTAPTVWAIGSYTYNCTTDLSILHTGVTGFIQGAFNRANSTVNATGMSLLFSSSDDTAQGTTTIGPQYMGANLGVTTDYGPQFLNGSTIGQVTGGVLSVTTGRTVQATAGTGYVLVGGNLKYFSWGTQTLTVDPDVIWFIYIDDTGTIGYSSSNIYPDENAVIILGKAASNATDIVFIQQAARTIDHVSTRFESLFRRALGPIYSAGSIVTKNGNTQLDVTSGYYFFGSAAYVPSGGAPVSWTTFYKTLTVWTDTPSQNTVDYQYYNDLTTGTLAAIPANNYARHTLYVVNDGAYEKYLMVYGQTTYAALVDAENGADPTPPDGWMGNIAPLAAIIVCNSATPASRIAQIRDERPRLGYARNAGTVVTDHGNLTGLLDDDHPQYVLVDGTRAMTGALQLTSGGFTTSVASGATSPWTLTLPASGGTSGYALTTNGSGTTSWTQLQPVGTYYAQGGNAFGATGVLGTTDAYGLNLVTGSGGPNTRLSIGSTGTIAIPAFTVAGVVHNAVTTGALSSSLIVNADVDASAGIVDTKLATISTAGKVSNSATTATSANTASAIVARDGSGDFSAGTITANLVGNVDSAALGTLGLGTTNASTINIATSASAAQTVNIGAGGAGVTTINLAGTGDALTIGGATNYYNLGVPSLGEHVVLVHTGAIQGPNEFNTIAAALTYIGTPSDPWTIEVAPGTYVENNPLTLQPNISIIGNGEATITASNPASTLIVGAPNAEVVGVTLTGATTTGTAAIKYSGGAGEFAVNDCAFGDNDICISLDNTVGSLTAFISDDCTITSTAEFSIGLQAVSTTANPLVVSLHSLYWLTSSNTIFSKLLDLSGPAIRAVLGHISAGRPATTITGTAVEVANGAQVSLRDCAFHSFDTVLSVPTGGSAPQVEVIGTYSYNGSNDLNILHTGTTGLIQGAFDKANSTINATGVSLLFSNADVASPGTVTVGSLYMGFDLATATDVQPLFQYGSALGQTTGGVLSVTTGRTVQATAGTGYVEDAGHLLYFPWITQTVTVPANSDRFIYVDNTGTLSMSASYPDELANVVLGKASADSSNIVFIQQQNRSIFHAPTYIDTFLRNGLGPIYSTGSIVSKNGTVQLDVGSGFYYFGTHTYAPSGGTAISWVTYYRNSPSGWVITPGVNTVDYQNYDDGSGTLAPITTDYFARHKIYVVGDGTTEKYLLVYGTAEYQYLVDAENGADPNPPSDWTGNIAPLAAIIVKNSTTPADRIQEIIDERPRLGFAANAGTVVTAHGDLTGLLADDHPQYLLVDGTRAMTGSLKLQSGAFQAAVAAPTLGASWTLTLPTTGGTNGYALTTNGSGTTSWTAFQPAGNYLVNGGNTGPVSAGTSDNTALNLITNTATRLSISNAGTIAIPAFSTAGLVHNNASGQLTSSAVNLAGGATEVTGTLPNANTTATAANTASAIVARNGSNSFNTSTIALETTVGGLTTTLASGATGSGWTLTLPTTAGTSGYALTTNGSGTTTWTDFTATGNFFKQGGNTFGATGVLGTTDANGLDIVTGSGGPNTRLSIGSTGTIAIPAFTTAGIVHNAVTTGNLSSSLIVNADVDAAAGIVDTKLATIGTAGKVSNSATTATSANTASAIVARNGSNSFNTSTIALETTVGGLTTTLASGATGSSWTLTLPTTGGTSGYALTTNGSGTTSWTNLDGIYFKQNGNAFGAAAVLGTTDSSAGTGYALTIQTGAVTGTTGAITVQPGTGTVTGGVITLQGGAGTSTNGGAITIRGGNGGTLGGGVTIDTGTGGSPVITIGGTNCTTVNLGRSGQTTDVKGNLQVDGTTINLGPSGSASTIKVGQNASDAVSVAGNLTLTGASKQLVFTGNAGTPYTIGMQAPTSGMAANYTLTLPTTGGTSGYALITNGSGTTSWSNLQPAGNYLVNGGNAGPVSVGTSDNTALNLITNTATRVSISNAGAVTIPGSVTLTGNNTALTFTDNTTNTIGVKAPSGVTSYTFTLPATGGTSGYALTTNGSGTTSWTTLDGNYYKQGGNAFAATGVLGLTDSNILNIVTGGTNGTQTAITINPNTGAGIPGTVGVRGTVIAPFHITLNGDTLLIDSGGGNNTWLGIQHGVTGGAGVIGSFWGFESDDTGVAGIRQFNIRDAEAAGPLGTVKFRIDTSVNVTPNVNLSSFFTDVTVDSAQRMGIGFTPAATDAKLSVNGSVHIGAVTNPGTNSLQVDGNIVVPASTSAPVGVMYKGSIAVGNRFIHNVGTNNLCVGVGAGSLSMATDTATDDTALGYNALTAITSGDYNTAVGSTAGDAITTGGNNTALGYSALGTVSTTSDSTAVGYNALVLNTAAGSTAVGSGALATNATGTGSTGVGYQALTSATGNNNTAVGFNAGYTVSSGANNTALGYQAGYSIATTGDSTAVGYYALRLNTAAGSTAVGASALATNAAGTGSTAVGYQALTLSIGNNNTAVGYQAGDSISSGTANTVVGASALITASTTSNNTAIGYGALAAHTGTGATAVGYQALNANTGGYNTAVGYQALLTNTSGTDCTAVGTNALTLSTGNANTAVGASAGRQISTGANNAALGANALSTASTTSSNTAVGSGALTAHTGTGATGIGYQALNANTGDYNTAVGYQALLTNTSGTNSTAVGAYALDTSTGNANTAVGYTAGTAISTGTNNTALGSEALNALTTTSSNVAVGYRAMYNAAGASVTQNVGVGAQSAGGNSTGLTVGNVTAVGYQAGDSLTSGSNNTLIGSTAGGTLTTGTNNIFIGNAVVGNAVGENNTIRIGVPTSAGGGSSTACYISGIYGVGIGATYQTVRVTSAGRLGIASSSRRFKENIVPITGDTPKFMQLQPVSFNYIGDPTMTLFHGLIAEDTLPIYPEMVQYDLQGEVFSLDYDKLHGLYIYEIQQARTDITTLQSTALVKTGNAGVVTVGSTDNNVNVTANAGAGTINLDAAVVTLDANAVVQDPEGTKFLHTNGGVGDLFLGHNAGGAVMSAATQNTGIGTQALSGLTTGGGHTALGSGAGSSYTVENGNVAIGNTGTVGDEGVIRLGTSQTKAFVAGVYSGSSDYALKLVGVDSYGQLATQSAGTAGFTLPGNTVLSGDLQAGMVPGGASQLVTLGQVSSVTAADTATVSLGCVDGGVGTEAAGSAVIAIGNNGQNVTPTEHTHIAIGQVDSKATYTGNTTVSDTFINKITSNVAQSYARALLSLGQNEGSGTSIVNIATGAGAGPRTVTIGTGTGATALTLGGVGDTVTIGAGLTFPNGVPWVASHTLFVHTGTIKGPNEFNSVKAAVDSITPDGTAWSIKVAPGTYVEDTITMKPYVAIIGDGNALIVASDPSKSIIVGSYLAQVIGVALHGATAPGTAAVRFNGGLEAFFLLNCYFYNNDIQIAIDNTDGAPTIMVISNCTINDRAEFRIGVQCSASDPNNNAVIGIAGFMWYYLSNSIFEKFIEISGEKSFVLVNDIIAGRETGTIIPGTPGAAIEVSNGGILNLRASNFHSFKTMVSVPYTVGDAAPGLNIMGVYGYKNQADFNIAHPGTVGIIQGTFERSKMTVHESAPLSIFFSDPVNFGTVTVGPQYVGSSMVSATNVSPLMEQGATLGVVSGGTLSVVSGLQLQALAGCGYLMDGTHLKYKCWDTGTITLPASSDYFIYVDGTGTLQYTLSQPDPAAAIVLGKASTDASSIIFLQHQPRSIVHATTNVDSLLRCGIGPIYYSGSMVSKNSDVSLLKLDVSSGRYFYGTHVFNPSGGSAISWLAFYKNGSGGWTIGSQSSIDYNHYDDASGTLALVPADEFARHALYVVNDGASEKYLLTYGQTTFASLLAAQNGSIPTPPASWNGNIALVASLIVKNTGTVADRITEIRDERPRIGFKASGLAVVSDHGDLTGLLNDNHPQYLLGNGTRAMTGGLQLQSGSYKTTIAPATTLGVDWTLKLPTTAGTSGYALVTDGTGITSWSNFAPAGNYLVNGGNAGVVSVGSTNNSALNIMTNTANRLTISGSGAIAIPGFVNAGVVHNDASGVLSTSLLVNADIDAAAAIADSKLATISTAGKVANSATTATDANTANALVTRDASGNFAAGIITANLTGNMTGNIDSVVSGTLSVGSTNANTINIGTSSSRLQTVNIGYGNVQQTTINIGGTNDVVTAPNLYAPLLDAPAATALNIGATNATAVTLGKVGALTTVRGMFTAADGVTLSGVSAGIVHADSSGVLSSGLIVNEYISPTAAIVDTKLATISTAGKVANSATTATAVNTVSTIVARDQVGNFAAGTITATLTGAASLNVLKAGDTMTGALTLDPTEGKGSLVLKNAGDTNALTLNSAATTPWTLTLPTTSGTQGQVLTTDGGGTTSWATPDYQTNNRKASVYLSTDQTVTNTAAVVVFDTTLFDPMSRFDSITHAYVVPANGYYLVTVHVSIHEGGFGTVTGVTDTRHLRFLVDGLPVTSAQESWRTLSNGSYIENPKTLMAILSLAAGQSLTVQYETTNTTGDVILASGTALALSYLM